MEIVIEPDADAVSSTAASVVADLLERRPDAVLGLPTGSTPAPLYQELIRRHREEDLDFSRVTTFNVDEYVGLPPDHPASYRMFMREQLFDHVNLSPDRTHVPDGTADDISAACRAYEDAIRAADGIDLQILGVGVDGHIGFNEPTSSLASRTRIKSLTDKTRRENARFFNDKVEAVPHHVVTMGIGTILESRHVVLLATGKHKANAVTKAVEGPVTARVPASALQLHPHVTVIVDEDAAGAFALRSYYEETFATKPPWQDL